MKSKINLVRSAILTSMALVVLFIFACKHDKPGINIPNNTIVDESLKLTQLKVAGMQYTIQDQINVEATENSELEVEYKKEPSDAMVTFEPELQGKKWILKQKAGIQTLTITLSKGNLSKKYEVNVIKLPKVRLTSFSINGSPQIIGNDLIIDCKKTKATSLTVTTQTIPPDAKVSFTPALETGNVWNLGSELGEKTLKITVKKDSEETTYIAKITRIDASSLSITKIKIGNEEKNDVQILSNMTFSPINKGIANIEIETTPSDAKVDWGLGEVTNKTHEWFLAQGENTLEVKITRAGNEEKYTLKLESTAKSIAVDYSLNNVKSENIENDFKNKEEAGKNPLYDAKLNHVNIQMTVTGKLAKILINGTNINATPTENVSIVNEVILLENEKEKEIEILIYPEVESMQTISAKRIKFRALGNSTKAKANAVLQIDNRKDLPADFTEKLESEESPLHKVHKSPAYLDVMLTGYEKKFLIKEIKINEEVVEPAPASPYIVSKEIELKDDEPTPVKIEFVPYDERFSQSFKWTFALQSGGKDKIPDVELHSINDVDLDDLPKALTEHLTDATNPLYRFDGKNAKVIISCGDANKVKEVVFKMDEAIKATVTPVEDGFDTFAKYIYEIHDKEEHNIEIEMKPEDAQKYEVLTYKFRLQSSGQKLKFLPNNFDFSINGTPSSVFEENIRKHLTDGSAPEYVIDGTKFVISLKVHDDSLFENIKHTSCTLANNVAQNVSFTEVSTGVYQAMWKGQLPDKTQAHLVKMTIVPKDATLYEELTYSVNLKSSGNLLSMPLIYGVNTTTVTNGQSIKVNATKAIIRVQARMDIISSVTIGKEGDEASCPVQAMQDKNGERYWEATREVELLQSGAPTEMTFKINVTPSDTTLYKTGTCTVKITGSKPGNAKFAKKGNGQFEIAATVVEKMPDCDAIHIDDYGILKLRLTAKTLDTTSTVHYSIVNLKGEALGFIGSDGVTVNASEKDKTMASQGDASHESEEVYLFKDKPTIVKLYVVSNTGETDNTDGLCIKTLNYVELGWDSSKPNKPDSDLDLSDYPNKAWDVIEIRQEQIPADGRIHLLFRALDKLFFPIVANDVEDGQTPFTDGKDLSGDFKFCYLTTVDVSKLKTEPSAIVKAKCHIKYDGKEDSTGFVYNVKIKLAQ